MADPIRNPSEIFAGTPPQLLQYFALLDRRTADAGEGIEEAEARLALLEGRVTVAEGEITDAQDDINVLQSSDEQLGDRLDAVDAALDILDSRADGTDSAITALDARLDTAEGDIVSLDGRLDTVEPSLADAHADIAVLDGRIDALEAADPTEGIGALADRVDVLESREDTDDIEDRIVSDRVTTVENALNELWAIVDDLPTGGGSGVSSVTIASVSYADGGTPRLVGSIQLAAGEYAAASASIGCGDNDGVATLEVRKEDGTVITTVGGVAGGVQWRDAAAGFTLTEALNLDLVLYSDSLAQRAFLRGFNVRLV